MRLSSNTAFGSIGAISHEFFLTRACCLCKPTEESK
jgi:hypothetical protein